MRTIHIALTASALLLAACGAERSEPEGEDTTAAAERAAGGRVVSVTGGGPVIQVLPGPAQFADSAMPIIERMPPEQQQMLKMMARNGPFSDKVAEVSGTFAATYWDRGASGDSVSGVDEFKTQDGASWRVVLNRVAAQDLSPMEPAFGGVATDIGYHGSTGIPHHWGAR